MEKIRLENIALRKQLEEIRSEIKEKNEILAVKDKEMKVLQSGCVKLQEELSKVENRNSLLTDEIVVVRKQLQDTRGKLEEKDKVLQDNIEQFNRFKEEVSLSVNSSDLAVDAVTKHSILLFLFLFK